MEFDKPVSSATSFSKKITGTRGGLSGRHAYDGVFSGSKAKVGRGVEDYREIFGGSGGCSIPILDVPELKESKACVDEQGSSKLDYAKIFGGYGEADFGVGYEELFAKQKKVKKSSFKEARPPVETRSHVLGSEHFQSSEDGQVLPPDASFQSFDGVKQFNVSYHRTNPGKKNGINGTTHIAMFHAVPGYSCLIDEISPSQKARGGKPVCEVLNDAHLNINVGDGMKAAGKPHKKAVSGPQSSGTAKTAPRSPTEFQKKSSRNRSFSNDMPFDVFEIDLGTHQSRKAPASSSPPNFGNGKGASTISMNLKVGVPRSDASGNCSPPLFDEEIDVNSAAAASAAAVRKAIKEAQAKIKIAKELMERKKEGVQNHGKLSFSNGLKALKREVKTADRGNKSRQNEAQEMLEKEDAPKQVFTGLSELHNAMKASQLTPDFTDEKSSIAQSAVVETHSTASKSIQRDIGMEEAEDGNTNEEFFEAVGTEEHWEKALEFEWTDKAKKITPSSNKNEWMEKLTADENIKPKEYGGKFKAFEEASNQENVKSELNSLEGAFEWDMYVNIKSTRQLHEAEGNEENMSAHEHEEADQTLKTFDDDQEKYENKLKRLLEQENAKFQIQESEKGKDMKELKAAHDWVEIDKKQREEHYQEEMENRSDEVPRNEENKMSLEEIDGQKENRRDHKDGWDRVDCEEPKKGGWIQEENEQKQNDAAEGEKTEKSCEVQKEKVIKVSFNHQLADKESRQRLGKDARENRNENLEEATENEKILREDYQMNETETRQEKGCEWAEIERMQSKIYQRTEDEKNIEATQQGLRYLGKKFEAAVDLYQLDENENRGWTDKACGREKLEDVEGSAEVLTLEDNDRIAEVIEVSFAHEKTGIVSRTVEETKNYEEEENFVTASLAQGFIEELIKQQMAGTTETFVMGKDGAYFCETDLNFANKHLVTEYKRVCDQERGIEEMICELDKSDEDAIEPEVSTNNEENENNFIPFHEKRLLGNGIESLCDPEKQVEELACGLGENYEDIKEFEVSDNHEENESSFESSSEERWVDNGIETEASQQPIFEEQGKTEEIYQEEKTSQSTDQKEENHHETLKMEEKEAKDTVQKEEEVEKKHFRKKEETKEREMEKEKERVAVERAIREARERAFAETRERAEMAAMERAAAEAHQRLKAEARERIQKPSAESNGKSAAEKASMEAKLKAERAAVERATAEARERALEKALSEKAAHKARNQAEKLAAEKFSGASRDDGFNPNEQHYKGPVSSSSLRYPTSSNNGVPNSNERSTGANDETAQRCKARLERHQRTAERAAKALAEKNMRDLLAQKEQAERNRLAQTLDADVRRWSSGKERNLRALLSTLQYILGPDSGWQPIPLTDLISTAAVKKAYRKATLYVHPDKLQQRGASIQQKYTCEKVFDLLKEGWNKFNAEER